MVDNEDVKPIPYDNIRRLLEELTQEIDTRFVRIRRGTRYENVRQSDALTFVTVTRGPFTTSEMAREMGISRQAIHTSVHRLEELGLVELKPSPRNRRDKIVALTPRGELARRAAGDQVKRFELELAEVIGQQGLESFRQTLVALVAAVRSRNMAEVRMVPAGLR